MQTSSAAWTVRLARIEDIPALDALIAASVRSLQRPYYSSEQIEAALGNIFAVDRLLIRDGTYFVVEQNNQIIGAGGWSRRESLCGGDGCRSTEDRQLDPQTDPARIRAFFVHPNWARRGIGRHLMKTCEEALVTAGFRKVCIVATLPGEPLYASFGYRSVERYELPLGETLRLPVVRMEREMRGG